MKKDLLAITAFSLTILIGCGQTTPNLDASNNNISDAPALSNDTVSINENAYGNESSRIGNSSSDGFQSIYFDFGDYSISSNMENALSKNVNVANNTSAKIKIEGNCDEFGTDEYNYALGLKRAKRVKDSMSSQGVNVSKMVMVSYGESNPICTESTDSCYGRNRRVDLRLVK
jgi:peptidoglycan-associated lipoprotein